MVGSNVDVPARNAFVCLTSQSCRTAIPFTSDDIRDNLGGKYDVAGIPRVVVLSATDGAVVNADARNVIVAKKSLDGAF
jgi:hypothetical protein